MASNPIGSNNSTNNNSNTANAASSALNNVNTDEFLKLMIAELQNQDPLDPMDSSQMLTQISQIRQVAASDKLSSTLDTVLLGQNLTNATSLIGKKVTALGDDNKDVTGVVDKVTVTEGAVQIHIGDKTAKITNTREILPTTATTT